MGLAVPVGDLAPVDRARVVHRPQRTTLGAVGKPHGATELENDPAPVEEHRDDVGQARHSPDRFDRQVEAGHIGLHTARRMSAERESLVVDEHQNLGAATHDGHVGVA